MSEGCWEALRETDWAGQLEPEFDKPYWARLQKSVADERARYDVYPPCDEVFAALALTSFADTKVVILGQDPYHGAGQAHGLAFSVRRGVVKPPSLQNIHGELRRDLEQEGIEMQIPGHGSLEQWAYNGVLLLNAALTVQAGLARSHRGKGWWRFTNEVIRVVDRKMDPVVFILWGADAKRKKRLIKSPMHTVIESSHPSPLSANRAPDPFIRSRPFIRANHALRPSGREVDWMLKD